MLRRFHEDLDRIGLRARRQHDARRTFISIARADGARADILRWATHGPTGDIVDDYTTLPWPALCEEVAKVRISVREGKLLPFPMAATGTEGPAVTAKPADPSDPRSTTRYSGQVTVTTSQNGGADGTVSRRDRHTLHRDLPVLHVRPSDPGYDVSQRYMASELSDAELREDVWCRVVDALDGDQLRRAADVRRLITELERDGSAQLDQEIVVEMDDEDPHDPSSRRISFYHIGFSPRSVKCDRGAFVAALERLAVLLAETER
jgi:hypothetical protein